MRSIDNQIDNCLTDFSPISRGELKNTKFSKRNNIKYVFSIRKLPEILKDMAPAYQLLYKGENPEPNHTTIYFDTSGFDMYNAHQNGKLTRCKVRYKASQSQKHGHLELKYKNNRKEKHKRKIKFDFNSQNISEIDCFIKENSPFSAKDLNPQIVINYKRLTFVNIRNGERITCDYQLNISAFDNLENSLNLEHLCVIEIKRANDIKASLLQDILLKHKINLKGLSKYCIGLTAINKTLKSNRFKEKLRMIEKMKYHSVP